MPESDRIWWKEGTVYQVYPASFKDSNGDGMGDLPGIISKLDYLKDLGVDIVWVCPHYDSPQVDMGYDVSDYENIYPPYGTIEDCELLIYKCHELGMKIIFDLVINHTSDQHAWFQESRRLKESSKHDWYIWKPAKWVNNSRMPPNNWRSYFGGSAWEWVEECQEYYLHLFAKEQPDLNWENKETRKAIYKTSMTFWLERGVDGFRVDTVNMYSKTLDFPDAPIVDPYSPYQPAHELFCNGPRMHEYLGEMRAVLKSYKPDGFLVGELPHTPDPKLILDYVSKIKNRLDMVFDFDVCDIGLGKPNRYEVKPWKVDELKTAIEKVQNLIIGTDAWCTVFLENHDQGRSVSRYASDTDLYREKSGKLLAMMLATLSGTLFIYQGQEIGMVNVPKTWGAEEYQCIEAKRHIDLVKTQFPGDQEKLRTALAGLQFAGRDNARTPMQWDDSPNAGFSTTRPWMRVNDNYTHINVAAQQGQDSTEHESLLEFWKKLLKLRKCEEYRDLLVHGDFYRDALPQDTHLGESKLPKEVFAYTKKCPGEDPEAKNIWVVLNFSDHEIAWDEKKLGSNQQLPSLGILCGNYSAAERGRGKLMPWEGRIYVCVPKG